ncbi:hypothetical protein HZA87_01435 [Candidatus Uhrbacteria bacterium]|nr:hypothetical protein [Candidatus Uhrbacteria bacterium]
MSRFLPPGSIKGIDHVTFAYPRWIKPGRVISFFETLGIKATQRDEPCRIDDFLPGMRYDFRVGNTTVTFAPGQRRFLWPAILVRHLFHFRSHVAFLVSPEVFDRLLDHPRMDRSLGEKGKIRWGTGEWSVFLDGPYALRFEFRCPTAHHLEP